MVCLGNICINTLHKEDNNDDDDDDNNKRIIMIQPTVSKCRICYTAEEHIKHIVVRCPILVPSEYTHGHNNVVAYTHWTLCKRVGLQGSERYYEHT
jgi:hypothetical protein